MVFGGLMLPVEMAAEFKTEMQTWRQKWNMSAELKWSKISNGKHDEYRDYVDCGLRRLAAGQIVFRSIVLERRLLNYRRFQDGDAELGFHKFLYQLIFHCFCKRLCAGDRMVVFLDRRQTTYDHKELAQVLNASACRQMAIVGRPVAKVEPINSKHSELMQLNDVLMGAVGFHNNCKEKLPGTRQSKKDVAMQIASAMNLATLKVSTSPLLDRFGVWQFRLQE